MRWSFVVLGMLLFPPTAAVAQVGFDVSIGINLPVYPQLVRVPGYPVYYAPGVDSNYFFYDGMYWVYQGDGWYASSWYNGPWSPVAPEAVPLFVLRVPVGYYRRPPPYFHGWRRDAPPRWGEHWGPGWEARRRGWDRWDRRAVPRPAPLPSYQRRYAGDRYPHPDQQRGLLRQHYGYAPRDATARRAYGEPGVRRGPPAGPRGDGRGPPARGGPQPGGERMRPAGPHPGPAAGPRYGQPPRAMEQNRGRPGNGRGPEQRGNRGQGEDRGRGPGRDR